MSAQVFVEQCQAVDLRCIGQEIVNRRGRRLIDCFSLVTRPGSRWDRPMLSVVNANFMDEAASASGVARVYTSLAH